MSILAASILSSFLTALTLRWVQDQPWKTSVWQNLAGSCIVGAIATALVWIVDYILS